MPLTRQELESRLWRAADILRGQIDAADYKNYIFSILFLKRLSDRFEEEVQNAVADGVFRWRPPFRTATSTSSSFPSPPAGPPSPGLP